ncbi:MAG: hypothetical protein ACKO0Z_11910 [Betaproteobacteria bacterium]
MELAPDTTLKGVRRWAIRSGYELGSHVYPGNLMLASREDKEVGDAVTRRDWALIRFDSVKKRVEVLHAGEPLQATARYYLAMALAERGVSPNTKPAKRLTGVPFYPRCGV